MTAETSELLADVEAAIDCNNIGVQLLRAGKFRESLETLKMAAILMHPVSKVFDNWSHLITLDNDSSSGTSTQPPTPSDRDQILFEARKRLSHIPIHSENVILENDTCADPLLIDSLTAVKDTECCQLEAATMAYNIGLNYQLLDTAPYIKRAICVYDMAFSLALSAGLSSLTALNVAIACLNNSGVIYFSLAKYPETRQCMDTLSIYINQLPLCTAERSAAEKRRLLLNARLLNEPKNAGAA